MKKQLLLLVLVFVTSSLFFIGCNEDDGPTTIDPDRIARFLNGEERFEIPENATDIFEIPVYINYDYEAPVTVFYEIIGDQSNYEMISEYGQAVIPAGQRQGVILIKAVDNDFINEPVNTALIRITGSDSGFESPSGVSIGHAEKILVFTDNECPVGIENFVGTYNVSEVFTSGTNEGLTLAEAFDESYQIEMDLTEGDDTGTMLTISNSAGYNTYIDDGSIITLDACGLKFSFNGGNPTLALFATHAISESFYDPNSASFTARGPLGNFGPYEFILTKQ